MVFHARNGIVLIEIKKPARSLACRLGTWTFGETQGQPPATFDKPVVPWRIPKAIRSLRSAAVHDKSGQEERRRAPGNPAYDEGFTET